MKTHKPLSFNDLIMKYSSDITNIILDNTSVPEKYLHWDDIYNRYSNEEEAEKIWLKIKLNRSNLLKEIPLLTCKEHNQFQFYVTDKSQGIIHSIEKLHSMLLDTTNQVSRSFATKFLNDSLIMEESISSSQLEGAATTSDVAKKMLEQERKPKTKDEKMIINNHWLMRTSILRKYQPLSIKLIKEFHRIATREIDDEKINPGDFRKNNNIYIMSYDNEVLHIPPNFDLLDDRLKKICEFANTEHNGTNGQIFIHPVIKAIILHFIIAYEHPFNDGNGRTARAIFYWYMLKNGYDDFKYVSISSLLKKAPSKYAKSYLYTETDDNDLTYYINYQLEIIDRAIKSLIGYLERKLHEINLVIELLKETKLIKNKILNKKEVLILKKAIKEPGIRFTVTEIKNDLGMSDDTSRKYLKHLVSLGFLTESNSPYTQKKFYIALSKAGMEACIERYI